MPEQYTLEEARAYFAEKGVEFTPAVQQEMQSRGMLAEPQIPPETGRDPRFAAPDAIPVNKPLTHDPYAVSGFDVIASFAFYEDTRTLEITGKTKAGYGAYVMLHTEEPDPGSLNWSPHNVPQA